MVRERERERERERRLSLNHSAVRYATCVMPHSVAAYCGTIVNKQVEWHISFEMNRCMAHRRLIRYLGQMALVC